MEAKNEMKKHIIKIGILTVAIITLGISLSYAYYSANMSGKAEITKRQAARLDLTSTLTDAQAINNSKLSLINASEVETKSEKVEFAVQNASTSTVAGKYYVYLTNIEISKNLYSKYFKWELVRVTSSGESKIANGDFSTAVRVGSVVDGEANNVVTTAEDIGLNKVALQLAINTKDDLIFRLWLENDENINQIDLTSGSFKGKLKIEATPVK